MKEEEQDHPESWTGNEKPWVHVLALLTNKATVSKTSLLSSSLSRESLGFDVLPSNAIYVIVDNCLLKLLRK